jgi:hypothetical protein
MTTTTKRAALCSLISSIGLLLIAIATLIPIISGGFPQSPLYKYLYSAGAIVCLLASLFNPCTSPELLERRWHRIEGWSSLFFCGGAATLFVPGATPRDWLAFTLAAAVIRIICFFRGIRADAKRKAKG